MTRHLKTLGLMGVILATAHGDGDKFLEAGGGKALALGLLLAILSAVANGSFSIFSKLPSVLRAHVDPIIFNFWASWGVVLSSLLMLLKCKFVFAPQALLSGLFFSLSFINAFRAVQLIGVSVAFGIWAGVAVLVSFVAGELLDPHAGVRSILLAVIALVVILLGILGVSYAGHLGRVEAGEEEDLQTLLRSEPSFAGWILRAPSKLEERIKWEAKGYNRTDRHNGPGSFAAGVFAAVLTGLLGGLVLIPETHAPEAARGPAFLPSFGISVAIFTPIVTAIPYLSASRHWPDFAPQVALVPGIISGIVWNIGNVLILIAIDYLGYSIAYPIYQCGIFIAGIWGMLLFGEITGNSMYIYWVSGVVMLVGVSMLSVAR